MERFITRLKQISRPIDVEIRNVSKEVQKISAENPGIVSSITMGKELHAGHLMLLTIGEQMRTALASGLPIILINNNTGPRAAGALCNIARRENVSLEEAAEILNKGEIDTSFIVSAYRERDEDDPQLEAAINLLSSGRYDIFARMSYETKDLLTKAGFTVEVVSESFLLQEKIDTTNALVPSWSGSGFLPFNNTKRTVVLEKAGNLTATGVFLTSITAISEFTQSDFILAIDSMPDSQDASFVFSSTTQSGLSSHVPGAGVGFEGTIASGTKGEAPTIMEMLEAFSTQRPQGSLKKAALFLTLTRPVSLPTIDNSNLAESFYDFESNQALIDLLVKCNDEAEEFVQNVSAELEALKDKIADVSFASVDPAVTFLKFLPQKSKGLFI
ncbi:hypothetical protein A2630_03235 [Candidatus Woesebacteria bacterium RIFCSPHIGHO2_01_FULL_44_10]|uniref:Uncharacterized protein n=1 Tax=Candidatus Woesebacteria bacterium RIFCSPLOWO2_01_FULL_44_14 TaxID=1802525 RepID=A0A1F8BZP2_9BACT|nr:MAG: hypothetical protein A2630_03235 [Candidatus Woesebacteria bacterium RIFCSPHIGHO2_01_FULL_44_10]OGM56424.1 MAG: hypothetical protein A3F62_01895 [Candidatus Woesebacteria bacterium RIFCSPHIGHO2_12_FULL_44_11]OGM68825.1 MAG: hypothetical protein A2975_00440 [Candidatus Woesebacteria bacterium RIFCSPLOWO2_01_FULL_44_14]